jgi:ubiquinone biosynthesis protein COQ4
MFHVLKMRVVNMSIYSHFVRMRNPLMLLKLLYKSAILVKYPTRLDEVIQLADDMSNDEVMNRFIDVVRKDPTGARSLVERPRVRIVASELRALPPGTLGREYIDFMDGNGLRAEDLPRRPADNAADYVRAHLFETHDVWHVVTGFKTDLAGELGLQAFYLAQLPAPLAPLLLAVGMANTLLFGFDDRDARMEEIVRGWRLGKQARPLFGQNWNDLWVLPLGDVRARLHVTNDAPLAAAA